MTPSPPGDARDGGPPVRAAGGAGTLRGALAVLSAALVTGAFAVPVAHASGGGTSLEGFWIAEAGVALGIAAWGIGRSEGRAARLAALFVLATAAQLSLTTPLWLQYLDLRPARLVSGTGPLAVLVLAVQSVVVLRGLRGRFASVAGALRRAANPRTTAVVAVGFVFTAAHASPLLRPGGGSLALPYLALLAAVAVLAALNAATLWLCVEAVPPDDAVRWRARLAGLVSLPGEVRPPVAADRWIPRVLAAGVLVVTSVLAVAVFERVVHVPDDGAYLFQAKLLASGRVAAAAPAVPEAFRDYLLDDSGGRWFATTNPGWPAVLAAGVAAGAPWLVNPVLAAVSVLLLHALVTRWSGRGTAHLVALLLAASPWFLFLAASFMTHVLTLVLLLAAWLLLAPREGAPGAVASGLAGALLGAMVLVRPLDGLLAGAFTGVWLLARCRLRWSVLVPYAIGCVAGSIALLPFNAALTGDPLRDPMNVYVDRLWYPGVNRLGFGADVGNVPGGWGGLDPLPGHGPVDVLLNLNQNLYNLNFELFGWSVGSLALVAVHVLRGRWSSLDRWMGGLAVAVAAVLSCYWFSGGPDFGARYWFLMIVPCLWLTARGALTFAQVAGAARAATALAVLLLAGLAAFVPWRATARYVEYRGFHADYLRLAESGRLGRSLVLVTAASDADISSALYLNPPDLDADGPIFARDLGPETERSLREAFPDRPVVRVRGRSATGTVTEISEGGR